MKKRTFIFSLLVSLAVPTAAQKTVVTRKIAQGVTYRQEIFGGTNPLVFNILDADLNAPGVKIRTGLAFDCISLVGAAKGRETLQNTAKRGKALAAINADFFPYTGDPVGLAMRDGELVSEPLEWRVCMGISDAAVRFGVLSPAGVLMTGDGFAIAALQGVNRVAHSGEIVCLTPCYAATPVLEADATVMLVRDLKGPLRPSQTQRGAVESVTDLRAGTPLPRCPADCALLVAVGKAKDALPERFKAGDPAQFRFDLTLNGPPPSRGRYAARAGSLRNRPVVPVWQDAQQAISGGPWLVRDGKTFVDGDAEDFPAAEFVTKRHPRTAAGITKNRHLLLVTVDGRQTQSVGLSLNELAEYLKNLGAVQAINLDGGGSTAMYVGGGIVNSPSDGSLRPIADSLLLYADDLPKTTPDSAAEWQIAPTSEKGVTVHVGETISLHIEDANGRPPSAAIPVVWGTDRGQGWITQGGIFRSVRPGSAQITARVGTSQIKILVYILSGDPATLTAKFLPAPNNPPDRNLLAITVADRFGNPVAGASLDVSLSGGTTNDRPITDATGTVRIEIVWDAEPGARKAAVRAGNAPPVTVKN